MIISTQIVTVWVLTLFMAYLADRCLPDGIGVH